MPAHRRATLLQLEYPIGNCGAKLMSPFRTQFDYSTHSGFTVPVDDEPSIQAIVPVSESALDQSVKRQWWSRMRRAQPDHPAADTTSEFAGNSRHT